MYAHPTKEKGDLVKLTYTCVAVSGEEYEIRPKIKNQAAKKSKNAKLTLL